MNFRYLVDRVRWNLWAWRHTDMLAWYLHEYDPQDVVMDRLVDDMPHIRDNCETCDGTRGTRGNENRIDGKIMCDYCHSEWMDLIMGIRD